MASYHLSVKPVSRSGGRSACGASAYRSGERVYDPRAEIVHDYTHRQGVEHAEIIGFDGTRQELWGQTEQIETRKNARLAVEAELALPAELTADQRRELVREFAGELAHEYGAAVDVAIHAPHREGDERNHHAHLLVGCRKVEGDRLTDRVVPFDGPEQVERWRERWSEMQNRALEQAKVAERVDHRSYKRQGIEQEPTVHMGPMVAAIERKAERGAKREGRKHKPVTEIGQRNEQTRADNLRRWIERQLETVQRAKEKAEQLLAKIGFKQQEIMRLVPPPTASPSERFYLDVPRINEQFEVLKLGAKADMHGRIYVPPGVDPAPFENWRPVNAEREAAALGDRGAADRAAIAREIAGRGAHIAAEHKAMVERENAKTEAYFAMKAEEQRAAADVLKVEKTPAPGVVKVAVPGGETMTYEQVFGRPPARSPSSTPPNPERIMTVEEAFGHIPLAKAPGQVAPTQPTPPRRRR